ncbi:hypothetical protein G6F37_012039 [Rhizopus arrhizus]|nr:hypothetical protein G6F38_009015 [Rhizopus arrhizus]KAG1146057.1 hypothetical protein G6F37_012039 [Rhizopus arrhizus]
MKVLYIDSPPPSHNEQLKDFTKNLPKHIKTYFKNMFPIIEWLPNYNWIWLSGDLTAAITVGTLVIPQSLAYAKMANLPPVYGLYTSFIGVITYPLFGTSKDISIGTSAIMSLFLGQLMTKFTATPQYLSGEWTLSDVATLLALFSGFIAMAIGLLRLGLLFHFICQPAIAGFMAGSGLSILINQFGKILGIPGINTTEAPYLVFGKTLVRLNLVTIDAAFGLTSLLYLYFVKYLSQYLTRRYPQHRHLLFFFNSSRSIVVLVFSTLICFMIHRFGQISPFTIIGTVPAGFGHMGPPKIKMDLVGYFGTDLISIVVLLIMEHGAISSSLGKIADYKVNMSQEVFTIGLSNIFGSFFGAYPGTGAFSRTAVMSKSGTRTPLTSFFVGLIVIVSIYVFTPAFTFIPNASLAAIIAHAVTDLISGPKVWKRFWDVHPSELLIFASAYIISLFTRMDVSIYVPVAISLVVQLYRIARPRHAFLAQLEPTDLYFPADHHPSLHLQPIHPSILCFQPQESLLFQNSTFLFEALIDKVKKTTRQGQPLTEKVGDRPWNQAVSIQKERELPVLEAIVLDLSGVHQMDYSGMELLMDTSALLDRYAGVQVRWYIVMGYSPTVRQCLLFAGFGTQRRHPLTGQFLSDLSRKEEKEERQWPKEEKKGFEEVRIEQVEVKKESKRFVHLNFMGHHNPVDDVSSVDDTVESGSRCGHSDQEDQFASIQYRFPYFFTSIHEAVKAALNQRTQALEIVRVVSDGDLGSVEA